jgi:hypothetical protein
MAQHQLIDVKGLDAKGLDVKGVDEKKIVARKNKITIYCCGTPLTFVLMGEALELLLRIGYVALAIEAGLEEINILEVSAKEFQDFMILLMRNSYISKSIQRVREDMFIYISIGEFINKYNVDTEIISKISKMDKTIIRTALITRLKEIIKEVCDEKDDETFDNLSFRTLSRFVFEKHGSVIGDVHEDYIKSEIKQIQTKINTKLISIYFSDHILTVNIDEYFWKYTSKATLERRQCMERLYQKIQML